MGLKLLFFISIIEKLKGKNCSTCNKTLFSKSAAPLTHFSLIEMQNLVHSLDFWDFICPKFGSGSASIGSFFMVEKNIGPGSETQRSILYVDDKKD